MAIHDAHYATPAPDWTSLCYRLQYIAEMRVGTRVRRAQAQEDAAFARVAQNIGE